MLGMEKNLIKRLLPTLGTSVESSQISQVPGKRVWTPVVPLRLKRVMTKKKKSLKKRV